MTDKELKPDLITGLPSYNPGKLVNGRILYQGDTNLPMQMTDKIMPEYVAYNECKHGLFEKKSPCKTCKNLPVSEDFIKAYQKLIDAVKSCAP